MIQAESNPQWHNPVCPCIQGIDGAGYMQKKRGRPKGESPAKETTEYIVSDFFTGKKTLKESLLALMIRDMKKL